MDFAQGDQQQMIREAVRAFAEKVARPAAMAWDRDAGWDAAGHRGLASLGAFGLAATEAVGGLELDAPTWTAALEELAAADAGAAEALVAHAACLAHLEAVGTAGQKATWAGKLAAGAALGCLAHEDDADNLDSDAVRTVAVADGAGWRLTGAKPAVVLGARAQVAVVTAVTQDLGLIAFLVPMNAPGVRVLALDALGLRSAAAATLELTDVALGADAVLGKPGAAQAELEPVRDDARLGTAAVALGLARAALREAGRYAAGREQFGKPISSFQPIQWMIANSATEIDAARMLVTRAAWLRAAGKPAARAIAMAKLQATEAALRAADRGLQVHGGYGYTKDFPIERMLRDAALLQILHGSRDLQRVRIGRSLAGAA